MKFGHNFSNFFDQNIFLECFIKISHQTVSSKCFIKMFDPQIPKSQNAPIPQSLNIRYNLTISVENGWKGRKTVKIDESGLKVVETVENNLECLKTVKNG